jgi:hypothetical protein
LPTMGSAQTGEQHTLSATSGMGHAAPPLRLEMPWLATRRFRVRQA